MNGFLSWIASPASEWHTASLQHKLIVATVGGGLGYYLYKKELPTWQIVLYALAAAYGTSMLLNAASQFEKESLPPPAPAPLPTVSVPPDDTTVADVVDDVASSMDEEPDTSGSVDYDEDDLDGIFE